MLITDLPIDIQTRIFAEIYWEERTLGLEAEFREFQAHFQEPLNLPIFYEHDTEWLEPWHGHDDLRTVLNPFPNSIASVCRLWQSIMSNTSRFWSRFILDLDDPACLPLDVFSWSKSRILDVVIKSRSQESSEDAKEREHSRVLTAFNVLTPHISSCKSVIFDVKYASSLPSPISFLIDECPHLKTLKLESQVDDMVPPISFNMPPTVALAQIFRQFQNLSLHGAMFMELSRADRTWLERKSTFNQSTTLTLSHLECSSGNETPYTVAELLEYLSVRGTISTLIFKHIRFLGEHGIGDPPDGVVFGAGPSLTFEDVDPGFMYEFMLSSSCTLLEYATFKNCRIPRISEFQAVYLTLTDIPDRRSLKNILKHHNGTYITITSCPGFNDRLLNCLATRLYVPELRNLEINQCDQFTVAGLRTFLKARKDGTPDLSGESSDEEEMGPITHLTVRSSGLQLNDEDKIWFKEYFGDGGYISWYDGGPLQHRPTFTHPSYELRADSPSS